MKASRPRSCTRFAPAAISLFLALPTPTLAQTTQPAEIPANQPPTSQAAAQAEPDTATTDVVPPRGIAACRSEVEKAAGFVVDGFAETMTSVLRGDPTPDIRADVRRLATKSRSQLDKAAARLADDELEADDDDLWELTDRVEMLRAFVEMFEAIASVDDSETSQERILDACNGIALYLDDPDPAIVESAKFWQGVAYRRAKKPERTLQTLRPVLTAPENAVMGLLARLEHCRALGDLDQHAAALALAMKLDARLDAWFGRMGAVTRLRAGESLKVLKVELLTQWAEVLERDGNTTAAENARREAKIVRGEADWPPKPARLLALDKTIGGLAEWKTQLPPQTSDETR